jgi:hypothetical protein
MFTAKGLLDDPTAIKLRCDGELLQKLKEAANKSLRSVNAEINFRLRNSFKSDEAAA